MSKERENIEIQINSLMARLSSNSSDIGDWKVIKCVEAEKAGKEAPYDFNALMASRQGVRDQINLLQAQLAALPEDEAE